MPSPFPGMNPFLEHPNIWHDFHGALAFRLRDALAAQLQPGYFIKVDENVYIHEHSAEERRLLGRPDVGIAQRSMPPMRSATAVLDAPVILQHDLAIEELREPFLMITDTRSREVVTIIEILSPSNKGRDRDQYLAKRNRILRSPTHLVEIDLLRSGERMPELDPRKDIDYAIMVSQSVLRPSAGFWLIRLREPLPQFSIPLHGTDSVTVELKPLIEAIHDAAHYQEEIYSDPITPPLSAEDAPWAAGLLAAAKIDAKV